VRVDSSKLKVHDPNAVEELLSLVVLGATFGKLLLKVGEALGLKARRRWVKHDVRQCIMRFMRGRANSIQLADFRMADRYAKETLSCLPNAVYVFALR